MSVRISMDRYMKLKALEKELPKNSEEARKAAGAAKLAEASVKADPFNVGKSVPAPEKPPVVTAPALALAERKKKGHPKKKEEEDLDSVLKKTAAFLPDRKSRNRALAFLRRLSNSGDVAIRKNALHVRGTNRGHIAHTLLTLFDDRNPRGSRKETREWFADFLPSAEKGRAFSASPAEASSFSALTTPLKL